MQVLSVTDFIGMLFIYERGNMMKEINKNIFEYKEATNSEYKSAVCEQILTSLPDWFGIPSAIENYSQQVRSMPVFVCTIGEEAIGFVALKHHNENNLEVYVIGVLQEFHRNGIGKKLLEICEQYCMSKNYSYLTVKTLADTNLDKNYAKTRAFYQNVGFKPLKILAGYWDEHNPCLLMIKRIEYVDSST